MYQESFSFTKKKSGDRKLLTPTFLEKIQTYKAKGIYLGTCSWKYRTWEGLVYSKFESEADFQKEALQEYAEVFPTVLVESTYYQWPDSNELQKMENYVPDDFRFCFMVPEMITKKVFPMQPRYGKNTGKINPDFLNEEVFLDKFLTPISKIQQKLGLLVFASADVKASPEIFAFIKKLPQKFTYAFSNEILLTENNERNKPYLFAKNQKNEHAPVFLQRVIY